MVPSHPRGAAVLDAGKTKAIRKAVFAELGESGWDGLTVAAVARRAMVGKPALYRRWASRDEMVVDCLVSVATQAVMPADTGSLRCDLLAWAESAVEVLRDPQVGPVVRAVAIAIVVHPQVTARLEARFRPPRLAAARAAFVRAIDRGEIPPETDITFAIDLFAGPFYLRALGFRNEIPDDFAAQTVDAVIRACAARE